MTLSTPLQDDVKEVLRRSAEQSGPSKGLTAGARAVGAQRLWRAGVVVAAAVIGFGGFSGVRLLVGPDTRTTEPAAQTMDPRLACDGGVNSGTPDHAAGAVSTKSPIDQANSWLVSSDINQRFAGLSTQIVAQSDPDTVDIVAHDSLGQVRAVLTYTRSRDGWKLARLSYC